ncbi:MAG: hypothetical protein IIC99_01730, partial [Chloroflexi bacterium]|nr:hypothetical protein [Chloroflexota bacterium]
VSTGDDSSMATEAGGVGDLGGYVVWGLESGGGAVWMPGSGTAVGWSGAAAAGEVAAGTMVASGTLVVAC